MFIPAARATFAVAVHAFPGSSQNLAVFLDAPGNATFGDAALSYMPGPSFFNEAVGFALIYPESLS